ncbi:MAG: hypothetical protein Tsb0010_07650 [Parvularculaceae bacterium]
MRIRLAAIGLAPMVLAVGAAAAQGWADEGLWEFRGETAEFQTYMGRRALHLKDALARLNDLEFRDGVIEFDIAFPEQRGFVGLRFRVQEGGDFEEFYIRTHQSGNPDANQYTPVFNGAYGWQIYYGERWSAPIDYRFDEWMRFKAIVAGDRAEFYLDDEQPFLHIDNLLTDNKSGAVELRALFTDAYISNFRVSGLGDAQLVGGPAPPPRAPENVVRRWRVSGALEDRRAASLSELPNGGLDEFEWRALDAEIHGIANLARANARPEGRNTVLARVSVLSDRAQIKRFRFGFSDRVRVYVNGALLFDGDDAYLSRDYRHLGTVGFYDAIHAPLIEGRNEIVLAVTEAFGGWAVAGAFDDLAGLQILAP